MLEVFSRPGSFRSSPARLKWRKLDLKTGHSQGSCHGLKTVTVTDGDVARLAAKPLHPLTLADLVKHGRPPLETPALLSSANFTLSILPSRLAHRIQSLRNLPYIVVANPHVSKIHNNYLHSLGTLLPYAERQIETLEDEIQFTQVMANLVQTHSNTISILARGFLEARKYISPGEVTRFLDEHLRARIGTRLVAEQHIALHFSSVPHAELSESHAQESQAARQSSYIGIIDTQLRPADIIRSCESFVGDICELRYGVRPTLALRDSAESPAGTTFAHVPVHLEYIVTELLKNAFRATIEKGMEREPVEVTIAPAPEESEDGALTTQDQGAVDAASRSSSADEAVAEENIRPLSKSTPGVTVRIRDRGGGISPENYAKLWEYGFTTFNEDQASDAAGNGNMDALNAISGVGGDGGSSLAGLGYGLPLGRAYAEYFGGGIAVQSLWGWGTDVYLSLRGVGRIE
ncbi:MAG: hypothetical protein M1821_008107 [Bathelium mastoideum]|nr:MAG: hypothetical protein M1821_008107 [Bathelium mastoideum]